MKRVLFVFAMRCCKHLGRVGRFIGFSLEYYRGRKHFPNLLHPKDLSERILSSMLKESFLRYSILADKIKVRDYVKSKGLEHLLLKQYGSWDNAESIDITQLPHKFILKPNNGSGGHVICRDKDHFDIKEYQAYLNDNLKRGADYFFEPHYVKIVPKILCEELLDCGEGKNPTDYKFTCIKGKIVDVFIAEEDANGKRKYATVDTNWDTLPYTKSEYLLQPLPPKPHNIDKMIEYAEILSSDFDFVRVDLYEFQDKVYFGELTFSPWGGFMYSYTDESLQFLGHKFDE